MRTEICPRRRRRSPRICAYADHRLWLALRRETRHVAWAGLHLRSHTAGGPASRFECEADAWLRGVGLVSVRHAGPTVRRTIDGAAARLGHSVRARLRPASSGRGGDDGGRSASSADRADCDWTAERTWEDDGGRLCVRTEPGRATARPSRGGRTRPRELVLAS